MRSIWRCTCALRLSFILSALWPVGFERVYEMNRLFRNEGISIKHNPEFTSIESSWAYATYDDLMKMTEELFQFLAHRSAGQR